MNVEGKKKKLLQFLKQLAQSSPSPPFEHLMGDDGGAAVVPPVSLNPPLVWGIISKISKHLSRWQLKFYINTLRYCRL